MATICKTDYHDGARGKLTLTKDELAERKAIEDALNKAREGVAKAIGPFRMFQTPEAKEDMERADATFNLAVARSDAWFASFRLAHYTITAPWIGIHVETMDSAAYEIKRDDADFIAQNG